MQRKRRSGRITKELDIVLMATDTTGKVFSEQTKTVVLSRHGAGIVSRYRFAPDEVMTLRLPNSAVEAEVRLVGQIGGEPGRYVYGVAFVAPDPRFWPMEFPPPEPFELASVSIVLECSICQARQSIEQFEIEEDVYSVNGNILRYCAECGASTPWKKAEAKSVHALAPTMAQTPFGLSEPSLASSSQGARGKVVHVLPVSAPKPNFNPPALSPAQPASKPGADSPARKFPESLDPSRAASPTPVATAPSSPYSAASVISEFASLAEVQLSPVVASATAVLLAPEPEAPPHASRIAPSTVTPSAMVPPAVSVLELDANGRPVNKRRHVRIRVSFSACVRHSAHADEVVECENVSKGGVCFHSLQQYELGSLIEIAAPYSPGEKPLFVPAQIKRVEALSGDKVFRYGVEYVKQSSAKPSF
jgi:PilZ domain-containing protein